MGESIEKKGNVIIVKLAKRLDVHKSVKTENEIIRMIDEDGTRYFLFDMSDVIYISSSGLRIFISTMRKLRDLKGELKIVGMKDSIKNVFMTVELFDLLNLYKTIDEALEEFGDKSKEN
jgi:anti-sigma B factor antagonist